MGRFTQSLTAGIFVLAACSFVVAGGDDAKKLQGTWEVTELIVGGAKASAKDIQGMKFVFKDDKLTIVPPTADTGVVDKRTFTIVKIDAAKKPAAIDLKSEDGDAKGAVSPGIFELKGNVLRWCQSDDEKSTVRPSEFKSPEKSRLYLFTFKRSK